MTTVNKRWVFSSVCLVASLAGFGALSLTGCATLSGPPEAVVAQRAQARYAALIAGQYEAAYSFFTPAFRQSWTYREYMIMRPPMVAYSRAENVSVKCSAQDVCEVGVNITYKPVVEVRGVPRGMEVSRFNEEKWIRVEGQWWFYQPE